MSLTTDTELNEETRFVNLIDNPERYTGYAGESAHKIWHSIYKENCFEFASKLPACTCFMQSMQNTASVRPADVARATQHVY